MSAQYYFTGEVKDVHGDNLQHVSILVQSTGASYKTGCYGNFEIISNKTEDSLIFSVDGYEQYAAAINAGNFLQVILKEQPYSFSSSAKNLRSIINGNAAWPPTPDAVPELKTGLVENPFVGQLATVSFTGGSDGVSYSNVKRFLDMGMPVPAEAVKLEEMFNYGNFYYEEPEEDAIFHCSSTLASCPWNMSHRLLFLNICARKADLSKASPANLVFLIDVSGSMDMPDKLPLIKSGLHLLIKNLREIDTVSLVEYGGNGRIWAGIPGSAKEQLIRIIEQLTPDGSSPGAPGLKQAYRVAQRQFIPDGNNKVILVTDGDITETAAESRELQDFVQEQRGDSIILTCLGAGIKRAEAPELSALATAGGGNFACIEDAQQGEKILLNELAPCLSRIAEKVCISTVFDTTLVKEYRLIGFENKRGAAQDTSFKLEGSSMSSGAALLALFEWVPKKDSAELPHVASVKINYCLPGQQKPRTMPYDCPNKLVYFDAIPTPLKKAACIALFGMKLKGSVYVDAFNWMDTEKMAKKIFSANTYIDKDYLASIVRARKLYLHTAN